jgi:hypothetical protein
MTRVPPHVTAIYDQIAAALADGKPIHVAVNVRCPHGSVATIGTAPCCTHVRRHLQGLVLAP